MFDEMDIDIGNLNAGEKALLAQVARRAGQAIADVMRDTELDATEKAEKIAAIKSQASSRARKQLSERQKLELSQEELSRRLELASSDVTNAMMRFASLEGGAALGGGTSVAVDSLSRKIEDFRLTVPRSAVTSLLQRGQNGGMRRTALQRAEEARAAVLETGSWVRDLARP